MYTITSDGEQMLRKWVQDSSAAPQTPKDEFRLRLFFSDCASANNRRQQLENRLAQHRQRLERLEKDQDKFDGIPPQDDQAFNDYLVLLGGNFSGNRPPANGWRPVWSYAGKEKNNSELPSKSEICGADT